VRLSRHHGLGNDFLVTFVDEVPSDAPDLARRLCDRSSPHGGADGLVFGTPSADIDATFTLINSDGSPAEVSGNGLRAFGQAIGRRDGLTDPDLVVDTPAGPRRIAVVGEPGDATVTATVGMGAPGPGPDVTGLAVDLGGPEHGRVTSVGLGNPHVVIEVADVTTLDGIDLGVVGPALEAHFLPTGCNIHLVAVVDRFTVALRPWERGAGLTAACGSGACAAAVAARGWGAVDAIVEVRMPGGTATVTVDDEVALTGPAVHEADIEIADG